MSWSNIQTAILWDVTLTGSSVSKAFPATVTAASVVSGAVIWDSSASSLSNITDDKGNTYTVVDSINDAPNTQGIASFYAASFPNGLPQTITANFSGANDFFGIEISEDSFGAGVTISLDGHNGAVQTAGFNVTGANLYSSGSDTTTANGNLINGFLLGDGGEITPSAGTSPNAFTSRASQTSNGTTTQSAAIEGFVQTTAGSIAATFGNSNAGSGSTSCGVLMLAFKAVASGDVLMPQIWL